MQALTNHFNHIMFLCKVENAVGKSTNKTAPSEVHRSGGSVYVHVYLLYSEYLACVYIYLCEKVQNTVCFIYMACSQVQVLLRPYVDVTVCPCAVVCPPDVQNCSKLRDLQCESLLQRAVSEATTQREANPQQEQTGFSQMKGAALYEQHDAPPGSYTTELRQRALLNGATTK